MSDESSVDGVNNEEDIEETSFAESKRPSSEQGPKRSELTPIENSLLDLNKELIEVPSRERISVNQIVTLLKRYQIIPSLLLVRTMNMKVLAHAIHYMIAVENEGLLNIGDPSESLFNSFKNSDLNKYWKELVLNLSKGKKMNDNTQNYLKGEADLIRYFLWVVEKSELSTQA